jgi:hypothetical protein
VKTTRRQDLLAAALACALAFTTTVAQAVAPLPSWNYSKARQSIVLFVAKVTKAGLSDFVPPAERIATFENRGTLSAEQPMWFQLLFAIDREKAPAPQHPEWKLKELFASMLKGDVKGAVAGGEHATLEIVMVGPSQRNGGPDGAPAAP